MSIGIRTSKPCVLVMLMLMSMLSLRINRSERLSLSQQGRYAYANHFLTGHNSDISRSLSRWLLLMLRSWLSSLAHTLPMFMVMRIFVSQVRVRLKGQVLEKFCNRVTHSLFFCLGFKIVHFSFATVFYAALKSLCRFS